MDKEKTKQMSQVLEFYENMQKENNVTCIEFHTSDGQKHGIGNPDAIKLLLMVATMEAERQLRKAQFGDVPEHLTESREYKAAMELERALNNFSFDPERFAQSVFYMHRTLQQNFFRTVKASILAMAEKESNCIDDRNEASHEMCQMLAPILQDIRLPFI